MRFTKEKSKSFWLPATLWVSACFCASMAYAQQCDNAPIATGDTAEYRGESALWVDVLANDSEGDGEELEIVVQSNDCGPNSNAVAEFGVLRLELPLNDTEDCAVSYYLRDDGGDTSSTATVQVTTRLVFADAFLTSDLIWQKCEGVGEHCLDPSETVPPLELEDTDSANRGSGTPVAAHRIVEATTPPAL